MAYEIKIEEMLKSENRDNIKIFFDRVKNEIKNILKLGGFDTPFFYA